MSENTVELDVQERFVDVAGLKIHVSEVGTGEPMVLLHGGGPGASGMSNFRTNLPYLGARFRLIIIDQPGFGSSSKALPEGESYWKFSARVVKEVMEGAGVAKAHFLGNSLGGGTALRFALDYPEMADRLVLMGPGGGSVNILTPGDIAGGVDRAVRRFYESPSVERMREFVDVMVYDSSRVSDQVLEERLQAATDPEAMAFMLKLFRALGADPEAELWKHVDRIRHRTLLVWGREDRVLPFDSSLLMFHRMLDVRLVAFSECGHWVQSEKQQEFDRLVADFLTAE
ncbi:alpha/beta fold hydrolase [Pseudonocardia sp. H11422]|uniref:alpha/beta fold hydrolase n=1 Tax=Pseudonocardia sp. H11422 TaxID=2835866 RepID=UPI001BDD7980|nr:alpha/beta fold hydrolase [Pseudonocardia sp. H11422]